jgi:hypothetical protein
MVDPIDVNRRNWDERATIHPRDTTGDYMLDRFRAGEDALHAIEAAELGDISGKRVLHLQCHIGRDTLCLVRRGAVATGLDFSGVALDVARRLSSETGLKADFVQGTVDEAISSMTIARINSVRNLSWAQVPGGPRPRTDHHVIDRHRPRRRSQHDQPSR